MSASGSPPWPHGWLHADWPAPAHVRTLVTTRVGGTSRAPHDAMNLGSRCGDEPSAVAGNRALLRALLPSGPVWMKQVHGTRVVDVGAPVAGEPEADEPEADAAIARSPGTVCAVLTADCLPVFLCDDTGAVVALAHAGWRGLAGGVLENTVRAMGTEPHRLMAWIGPGIAAPAYEVGAEVRDCFVDHDGADADAFHATRPGHWLADLPMLARRRLGRLGVARTGGGTHCTHADVARFYSFRRDGATGRMASLIWIQPS